MEGVGPTAKTLALFETPEFCSPNLCMNRIVSSEKPAEFIHNTVETRNLALVSLMPL